MRFAVVLASLTVLSLASANDIECAGVDGAVGEHCGDTPAGIGGIYLPPGSGPQRWKYPTCNHPFAPVLDCAPAATGWFKAIPLTDGTFQVKGAGCCVEGESLNRLNFYSNNEWTHDAWFCLTPAECAAYND
jgi:hypothetical protein